MVTAQEILQRIKDNGRREKTTTGMDKSNSIGQFTAISTSTISGGVHRLHTVSYTYEQEYELYINLVVYYILHPSIIPPLHPYQKMLQKIVPRVHNNLYGNGTYYCMIGFNRQLLHTVVSISKDINELNKVIGTLLASVDTDTLHDINLLLQERRQF